METGYDIVPLLGNHEAMLLDACENNELTSEWIQNGGAETLKSFEISSLKNIECKYLNFFKALKLSNYSVYILAITFKEPKIFWLFLRMVSFEFSWD